MREQYGVTWDFIFLSRKKTEFIDLLKTDFQVNIMSPTHLKMFEKGGNMKLKVY